MLIPNCFVLCSVIQNIKTAGPGFLERWLSLTQDEAKFQAPFSRLRTCNLRLQNTAEPLLQDTVMITHNVTQINA